MSNQYCHTLKPAAATLSPRVVLVPWFDSTVKLSTVHCSKESDEWMGGGSYPGGVRTGARGDPDRSRSGSDRHGTLSE
ncbi:hypothetical protein HispidOSU_011276 [Sigmodon hispidus]